MITRLRASLVAGGRGLVLALTALIGSVVLFTLTLVSVGLIPVGIGIFTTPPLLSLVRAHANRRRLLAAQWSDVRIPSAYRPAGAARGGLAGQVERCVGMLKDPATRRDVQWLFTDITAGAAVAVLAPALWLEGLFGLLLAAGLWKPVVEAGGTYWYTFLPVSGAGTAGLAAGLGTCWMVLATFVNPVLLRSHFRIAAASLTPGREELEQRIDRLTATRHDAVDTSAAELRRIERDLHDGAQARLVAMGMNLSTIEALVEKDPAQAKELIAAARASSAEALTELRDLVRGIHPPVLAERGLGDAVRALALRLPVPCEVDVEMTGRVEAPVESAAYFAVSEALTNAVKHGGGDRIWVDIAHRDDSLRVAVTDNGRGGASVGAGSGLSGVERRLGTFDGVLAVSSPAGGPTMVTMEIPCASS
ncbi:sensor histidine kinase [Streptomyces genisteinicus]|uniref:histidine kinase n=1 Tax=Streptomyces genisteinicus TaxID=2768068 RepID=A0A7H0HR19_9ACTN|nr:histidine kinase [Streptomyces genisteinicus]QNP62985.1 sensor domain-containing protein [Streptomyces genisteinicus]